MIMAAVSDWRERHYGNSAAGRKGARLPIAPTDQNARKRCG
jgi:hypothetical protein